MKNLAILLFCLTCTMGYSQGYQETFKQECNCFEVTNYYDGGQLSSKSYKNANKQMHGLETVYYQNGQKQYERTWVNGELDGTGTHYFRNGNLYYQEIYSNGSKSGIWKFFDETGDLQQEIDYSGGNNNAIYSYYHAGIKYLEQTMIKGKMINESVLNEEIYNTLKAEAEANQNAK